MKYLWGLSTLRQQTVACHCAILGSDVLEVFCGSSGSSDLKKRSETSWKHHQERTLRVGPLRSVSPLIAFTGSWRATTKPPHLYSNLLFSLFFVCDRLLKQMNLFFKLFFNVLSNRKLNDSLARDPERTLTAGSGHIASSNGLEGGQCLSPLNITKISAFSLIMLMRNQPYAGYHPARVAECRGMYSVVFLRICPRSWYFFPSTCCERSCFIMYI